jgi:hypothetical protein
MAIMWRENKQNQTLEKVYRVGLVANVFANMNSGLWYAYMNDGGTGCKALGEGFPTKESAMQWADNKAREL